MLVRLNEWAEEHYRKPPCLNTLRAWARNGLTDPPAIKHGNRWYIDEDAVYVGVTPIDPEHLEGLHPLALKVLLNQ